jgi:hypothetical protein
MHPPSNARSGDNSKVHEGRQDRRGDRAYDEKRMRDERLGPLPQAAARYHRLNLMPVAAY